VLRGKAVGEGRHAGCAEVDAFGERIEQREKEREVAVDVGVLRIR